jgi:predicted dinucleotide-binding enzyme
MNFGILGTGVVGRTLAARLIELNHSVVLGTRDPAKTILKSELDGMGNPPIRVWLEQNPKAKLGSFIEAAVHGEIIINATNGTGSLNALQIAGEMNLNNKILMDISNPLDLTHGMPPSLFISNTDSLGEQIQRAFPNVLVVKTLNTMNAYLMVNPRLLANGDHSVFVSGNDPVAKAAVSKLLQSFGWEDIIDLGDITTARGPEMYLPLWLRTWGTLQIPMFQIKVVR